MCFVFLFLYIIHNEMNDDLVNPYHMVHAPHSEMDKQQYLLKVLRNSTDESAQPFWVMKGSDASARVRCCSVLYFTLKGHILKLSLS